jgi:arylsulfatase B
MKTNLHSYKIGNTCFSSMLLVFFAINACSNELSTVPPDYKAPVIDDRVGTIPEVIEPDVSIVIPVKKINQQKTPPNIVIILADDLGWGDVGFHGSEIKTPNIDKLARDGVILDRYYVAPICSPTRAGLMTGRYPDRFGLRQVVVRPWFDFGVDTNEVLLPQMLAEAGYKHRAIIGKWHLGHAQLKYHPLKRGFTHFYGHLNGAIDYYTHTREGQLDWHTDYETSYDKGYSTDLITAEAVKSIKKYADQLPFFMYVAYNAPHGPIQAQEKYLEQYGFDENKPKIGKGRGKGNSIRQTYSAMVTNLDDGIGEILETLNDLGIANNTLVLFQSDNGAETATGRVNAGGSNGKLRGEKLEEWEGGVRVPAIIKWPDGFEGGRTIDYVAGYIDIVPTLREIVGLTDTPENKLDGMSILPLLKGEENQLDRNFYLGSGAIVNHDWKLVKATGENPKMKVEDDMLFNISRDPYEETNVRQHHDQVFSNLSNIVTQLDTLTPTVTPPKDQRRKGFRAPKEWKVTD